MSTPATSWYVVTGASRGIGYAVSVQLCRTPGTRVLALSRDTNGLARLKNEAGEGLLPLAFDLETGDPALVVNALREAGCTGLNGLLNNAGLLINKPFETVTLRDLQASYGVNVFAPYLLTQALLPLLGTSGKSHVVNISSMGGVQGSAKFAGLSAYSSAKGALCTLTECMAEEFKDRNIAVNCLALGAVQTEMLNAAFPGFKAPVSPEEMGTYVSWFLMHGQQFFNGKILPVASTTP